MGRLSQHVLHETRDELLSSARKIQLIADNGDPAECVIQTAEEHQADLILLGHRGMTESAGFLLGGVSQKVATYAPCSVLICKGAVPVLDHMLLAVDGSDASKYAAQFLGKLPFKGPPLPDDRDGLGPSAFESIGLCRQILICGPQNLIGQKQRGGISS